MRFDLKGAAITVESSADGVEYAPVAEAVSRGLKLRRGVEIDEVSAPGLGKVRRGEAAIALSPTGGPPFEVTLVSGKRKALVSYNPFTGRASVTDPDKKVSDG
ncbi:MAG: hypothetical protein A2V21_301565 [Deltaproteobacteria bacterium GWC2_55_46]|nr:MAG: hypothetical protein A2Z79_07100 [Deltaproteobacteria bacterium GWA2_55_82]OIJ73063.1 MAG: hypothetical protein A2V21_301565 [Deltaproteobacteria bacterium GWC2_55_46]